MVFTMNRKEYLDWMPQEDDLLRDGEKILHERIHLAKYKGGDSGLGLRQDRLDYISQGEGIAGRLISGTVLDIGCGNGYSSVHICQTRDIEKVYALECNEAAVDKLIRRNFEKNNISEDKYELVLGSFNKIAYENYYDFVISLGSLHHSSNLLMTMRELYKCLKPGGFVIAHEPYLIDETQNDTYVEKSRTFKCVQSFVNIQECERDDHFFRKCEYMTAFYHSNFIVNIKDVMQNDEIRNALMVLQKPLEQPDFIPHIWC